MRTVALISGGKDSCFNMLQCVAAGHEIVALANLKPKDSGLCMNDLFYFHLTKFIDSLSPSLLR